MWVRGGGVSILVDCGISAQLAGRRLDEIGVDLDDVSAVVCTHGHRDHIAGVAVLAQRHDLDVFATAPTVRRMPEGVPRERLRLLPPSGAVTIGGLAVRTVPTMHDIPGSVALVISDHDTELGVVTDLGRPTAPLVAALASVDGLALEFNHDVDMLRSGPYTRRLKRRILSERGHLSNEQSARLLAQVLHPKLQHLTLLHLSEHNNTPTLALAAAHSALGGHGVAPVVSVAQQHRAGVPVTLRGNPPAQLVMPWAQ